MLGLVLIGGFASLGRNAAVRELWDGAVRHLADPVDRGFVEEFQRSTHRAPGPPGVLRDGRAGEPEAAGTRVAGGAAGHDGGRERAGPRADRRADPAALGRRDAILSPRGAGPCWRRGSPDARLVVLRGHRPRPALGGAGARRGGDRGCSRDDALPDGRPAYAGVPDRDTGVGVQRAVPGRARRVPRSRTGDRARRGAAAPGPAAGPPAPRAPPAARPRAAGRGPAAARRD